MIIYNKYDLNILMSKTIQNEHLSAVLDINIINVDLILYWDIMGSNKICQLCKQPLLMPTFQTTELSTDDKEKYIDDENEINSNVHLGTCKHYFHEKCINLHLETGTSCPIDNVFWTIDKIISTLPTTICSESNI